MTSEHDRRTRIVVSWLREDGHENAERVLLAALNEIDHTRQRRSWWPAWRFSDMNNVAKALVATAAVIAVAFVGVNLLPRSGTGPGAQPSPVPTPSPSTTPTASPSPSTVADLPVGAFAVGSSPIAMTVTIPSAGWTFDPQFTVLVKGDEVANLPEAAVLFWSFPAGTEFYVYGDPCRSTSTKPKTPATTVAAITSGLAAQKSRTASVPADVTIGGQAGKSITLHVPDDAVFASCEASEFVSYGTAQDPLTRYHQGPGQIDELWIVDVDGGFAIIDAMRRADTPPALAAEMRTLAESVSFAKP